VRCGEARWGEVVSGPVGFGTARSGPVRHGAVGLGGARPGLVRHGEAWWGVGFGEVGHGVAR
jgi:hypothetical protein